jgi:hypothetical protein
MLMRVRNFRARENNEPTELYPDQKQRQSRETPVDRIIVRDTNLEGDVQPLYHLVKRSGYYPREKACFERNLRIGHKDIYKGKEGPHDRLGVKNENKINNGTAINQQFNHLRNECDFSGNEYCSTAGYDEKDRGNQYHGKIIRSLSGERSGFLDTPDVIQGAFDIPEYLYNSPEKDCHTNAGDNPSACVCEERIGKVKNLGQNLFLPFKLFQQPFLENGLHVKSFGNTKGHGSNGDNSKK